MAQIPGALPGTCSGAPWSRADPPGAIERFQREISHVRRAVGSLAPACGLDCGEPPPTPGQDRIFPKENPGTDETLSVESSPVGCPPTEGGGCAWRAIVRRRSA